MICTIQYLKESPGSETSQEMIIHLVISAKNPCEKIPSNYERLARMNPYHGSVWSSKHYSITCVISTATSTMSHWYLQRPPAELLVVISCIVICNICMIVLEINVLLHINLKAILLVISNLSSISLQFSWFKLNGKLVPIFHSLSYCHKFCTRHDKGRAVVENGTVG